MRRALSILLLAVAATAATSAAAQQPPARTNDDGQSLGLRYLTWPGRITSARTTPERPATVPARRSATAAPVPPPARRPTPAIIPHGTAPDPAATGPLSAPGHGLTPANAWMTPAAPAPVQTVPTPPTPTPPVARPLAASGSTSPAPSITADPMAPRRDALIYRMQGTPTTTPQPQPRSQAPVATPASTPVATSTAGPAEQGARYYSVHRQNNRQPDPTPLPASTYVDAIAVDLPVSLASQDLAAPPEPPALIRNAQGRLQAMPDTSTPDLP